MPNIDELRIVYIKMLAGWVQRREDVDQLGLKQYLVPHIHCTPRCGIVSWNHLYS